MAGRALSVLKAWVRIRDHDIAWPAGVLAALLISGLGQLVLVEVVHVGGRIW
jgi:hypothetical protein